MKQSVKKNSTGKLQMFYYLMANGIIKLHYSTTLKNTLKKRKKVKYFLVKSGKFRHKLRVKQIILIIVGHFYSDKLMFFK